MEPSTNEGKWRVSDPRTRCQGCGAVVSIGFARIFGDNDDLVDHCPRCSTSPEIHGSSR